MNTLKTILGVALFGALLNTASAQPLLLNYQGLLTDSVGAPLPSSGNNNLEFNMYTAATGGSLLWGPFYCTNGTGNGQAPRAIVSSGRFNVILGPTDTTSRSLRSIFTNADNVYLEVKVNGAAITPRQQFLTTAYAFEASHADQSSTVSDANVAYQHTMNVFATTNWFAGVIQGTNVNNQFTGNFSGVGTIDVPYVRFVDQRPKGVNGGNSPQGQITIRSFNNAATVVSTHTGWSPSLFSTNTMMLPPGTYQFLINAPVWRAGNHQARLKIVNTSGTSYVYGTSGNLPPDAGGDGSGYSTISGRITLPSGGNSSLTIEHYTSASDTGGMGAAASPNWVDGSPVEIYTVAEFWKIK